MQHTGFWFGGYDGKSLLGRPRRRWEDNMEMNLQGMGWKGPNWAALAQGTGKWRAFVNAVMNTRIP